MILYLVIIAIIFLASLITFFVLNNKSGALNTKKIIIYLILFTLIISALGLMAKIPGFTDSVMYFILLQLIFFGLGYLTSYLLKRNFWGELPNETSGKVLFVLSICTIGIIGFTILFNFFNNTGLAPYYSLSAFTFLIPQYFITSFSAYINIPQEIYKVWYFPADADEIDFEKIDTNTIYMLELEYSKSINDPRLTNTKLRAPLGMKFGDWFRSFIENYNEKYDEDPIHYLNPDNTPHGWIFYLKPSFLGTPRYIDPELTITENRLNEKNIIIARRVGIV